MLSTLLESFEKGLVSVFVGAGISTLEPSCLPSWWQMNHAILDSLASESESLILDVNRVRDYIKEREDKGILPPEFVAEIISTRVGVNYFEVLRALEGDEPNYVHLALAELARLGKLKWIITTNFDTLIEKAFNLLQVPLKTCVGPDEYAELISDNKLITGEYCTLLKLHGTASIPETCIDTLAQRKVGLNPSITSVLQLLGLSTYWFFLGYSGADFEAEPNYLGLRARSHEGKGIFWLQLQDTKVKGPVQSLLDAYGPEKAFLDFGKLPDYLDQQIGGLFESFKSNAIINDLKNKKNVRTERMDQLKVKTREWSENLGSFLCAITLADIGVQAGNYIDTKIILQTILEQFGSKLSPLYLGIVYQALGTIEYHHPNYQKALEYYTKALEPYKQADWASGYNASIQAIGNIYLDLGRFSEAEKIYLEYLEFAKQSEIEYLFGLKAVTIFYVTLHDIDKALSYLKPANELAIKLGNEIIRLDLLESASEIESLYGNYNECEKILLEILNISSRLGNDKRIIRAQINLAELYWSLNRQQEAFDAIAKADELAKIVMDIKSEIRIKETKGKFFYYQAKYDQAISLFEESLDKANELEDIHLASTLIQNLGLSYQAQGRIRNAIDLFQKEIKKMDEIGYNYRSAGIKNNLGNILEQQGNIDQALDLYLEINSYYESINDQMRLALAKGNIANIYYRKGIYSEAKKYYLMCLHQFERLAYIDGILRTLHNVAGVIYLEGNVEESKKYFLQSITKAHEFEQPALEEQFSLSYANVLFQNAEYTESISYYNKIVELATERNDSYMNSIAYYSLGLAYSRIENKTLAIQNLKKSIDLMEKLDTQLDIYPKAIRELEILES